MEINSYLLREKVAANFVLGANGVVASSVASVDIVSHVGVSATAAGLTFTLPAPTDTRSGLDFRVTNTGTNPFTIGSKLIGVNDYADFSWDNGVWHSEAPTTASGSDFWRTDPAGQMPDGTTDPADSIVRTGQTKIDTGANGDSGLTLDDLRSRNSVQLSAGDAGVTDTNMTAIGVDLNGKVRLSNQLSIPDLRATNPNPQDYAAGFSNVFKQSATIGMTGISNLPTYVNLTTTRQYANGTDFSGGNVRQDVDLPDGRQYYRMSVNGTTWGPWTMENQSRNLQDRFTSQATTKISINNELRWVGSYHIMTLGSNVEAPNGHFRIDMPADGFAVPIAGGGTRAVVAATAASAVDTGGILLNNWESLYYRIPFSQGSAFVPGNLLIVPYLAGTNGVGPYANSDEYIMIARRDDTGTFTLGTRDTATAGMQVGRGALPTVATWTGMKQRVMGSGYFFSPGGNTATANAFGFTGTIRWIDGGSVPNISNSGYMDVSNRAVGLAVRGVNGAANRTWRLMTAAEKPGWFGGMQRGVDPILAASSTVVDLNDNETLYLVPNLDNVLAPQWVVAGYSGNVATPVHWMPVASKQTTGGHSTIQVLLGGVQYALKAGDARYTSTNDATMDAIRRNGTVQFQGPGYCRFTTAGFFAGAGANGALGGTDGVMVSWDNRRLMYGISDGYANFGNQYTWLDVPPAGTAIPVVSTGSNVTRVVQTIGGRRYIPLSTWEALYWIPPAYTAGTTALAGDWVIAYYGTGNQHIPPSALLVAKVFSSVAGTSEVKNRILFADGSYLQPGLSLAVAPATENDHAQGSGNWRNATVAGGTAAARTSPGNNAPMTAVAGVTGNYTAPYAMQYRYVPTSNDARGQVEVKGLIELNTNVTTATANLAFLPGVQAYDTPIRTVYARAGGGAEEQMVPVQVRLSNTTVGNQNGVVVQLSGSSLNTAINPYFTLGPNGAARAAGALVWLTMDMIFPHN